MSEISTKQLLSILSALLFGLLIYRYKNLAFDSTTLHIAALCLAALLPAACLKVRLDAHNLTAQISLLAAAFQGGLWYLIIYPVYSENAITFAGLISCGSYLVLRLK